MKCAKCGAELKVGCIYCSVCGQEAQIVPDYNLLEDDFLKELLTEEKQQRPVEEKKRPQPKKKKSNKNKKAMLTAGILSAVLVVVIAVCLLINHSHNNSFDYQMDKAKECVKEQEYEQAQKCLKRAVELNRDSVEAWLLLADVYLARDEQDNVIESLKKVLKIESDNKEAYEKIIAVYAELEDYNAIAKLAANVEDEEIMDLFAEYLVTAPVPDKEPGTYAELISLEISSQKGTVTYYTLDGSNPKKGEEYTKPISLKEGKTTVRMISVNELGIYSEETECVYEIEFQAPDAPEITPDGGRFSTAQLITIVVPTGCRAYYTWDGSDPNIGSAQYTAPIEMPEGNNILSVILVNEHNLYSEITRCNFIYIP